MNRQFVLLIVLVGVSFAVGRYSVQFTEETKTVVDESIKRDKDVKTVTTETIVKEVDGKETRTRVTETDTKIVTVKDKSTLAEVIITPESDKYFVSILAGVQKDALSIPIYGLSASKKFIGPIAIGVWGLTNGTGGLSVGMSF